MLSHNNNNNDNENTTINTTVAELAVAREQNLRQAKTPTQNSGSGGDTRACLRPCKKKKKMHPYFVGQKQ